MNAATIAPETYQAMNFTKVVEFVTGSVTVKFIPENGIPGYDYKVLVIVDGKLVGKEWMPAEQKPTHKNAEFYYNKIVNHAYKF